MKLVVGLGNPGPRYADTRHNVGVRVAERFAATRGIHLDAQRFSGRVGSGRFLDIEVSVLVPATFMNQSGGSVSQAVRELPEVDPARDLLVVYDDLDLPFGRIRLRPSGGAGGHRGMSDVIEKLGRADFPRLRFGVGRPPEAVDPVEYVLESFTREQWAVLPERIESASQAVECALREGVVNAMNRFNRDSEKSCEVGGRGADGSAE